LLITSPDWLGSCQFTNQANEWVKDKRMQWVCVVIKNTQWLEDCKEQVFGFLPLRRKVSWIILGKFESIIIDEYLIGAGEMS
jgi:hypothetical protein